MEAKNESTQHFASKTGDKLFIEILITGNPDEVVNKIMKSISKDEELFTGAKCEQMLFKGKTVDSIINTATRKAIKAIETSFVEIRDEMQSKIGA